MFTLDLTQGVWRHKETLGRSNDWQIGSFWRQKQFAICKYFVVDRLTRATRIMFLNALSHLANSLMVPACGWAYARVKSKQPFWHTDRPENHDPNRCWLSSSCSMLELSVLSWVLCTCNSAQCRLSGWGWQIRGRFFLWCIDPTSTWAYLNSFGNYYATLSWSKSWSCKSGRRQLLRCHYK